MTVDTEPQVEQQQESVEQHVEAEPQAEQSVEQEAQETQEVQQEEETKVPLSALQKERKRRQEQEARAYKAEAESQVLREQFYKKDEPEEDDTSFENVTKGESEKALQQTKAEIKREVKEEAWASANPELYEYVNENLTEFLKQRPNLHSAINGSSNRYAEAYELMSKLTGKEQKALKPQAQKKVAPGSPTGVPKAAALNQSIDVMSMSDEEYRKWRDSKKRGR